MLLLDRSEVKDPVALGLRGGLGEAKEEGLEEGKRVPSGGREMSVAVMDEVEDWRLMLGRLSGGAENELEGSRLGK